MSARQDTNELMYKIQRRIGISLNFDDANTLRRAEIALGRWGEQECGDGSNWYIQRDETTGIPYRHYCGDSPREPRPYRIADREAGALRRIAEVCKRNGLHYFHQTDPRGCSLYVSNEPLTNTEYTRGVACCA